MEEDHDDDAFPGTGGVGGILDGGEGDPGRERAAHARVGDEEEGPPADAVDEEGEHDGFDPVGSADDAVELVLEFGVGYADVRQDLREVVARETGARELGEQTAADADENASAVAPYFQDWISVLNTCARVTSERCLRVLMRSM